MISCIGRRCISSISFIHPLDGFIFHCECAACVSRAWSHTGEEIQEYSWRLFGYWWSQTFSYLFMSGKKCRAGRNEVKHWESWANFITPQSACIRGSQASLCLDKWFCMQYDGQGALLRAGCMVLWSNLVVLSSHYGCNAPLSPSLVLPPTSPMAPFIPPAFSPLTLRSLPLSWWVSQLTIWPTKDPKRLSSATVQAMTGWGNEREEETERRYVQYSSPSLIICHSCLCCVVVVF